MEHPENNFRGSRLRAPAIHSSAGLMELTDSQHNARATGSGIPPPGKSLKRELAPPVTQPEPKRKTMAERAGEYPQKPSIAAAAAATRSSVPIKGTSLTSASGLKQPSHSRQIAASRNGSNTSFASSQGPGSKSAYDRPKTSQSNHSRSVHGGHSRTKSQQPPRPRTAWGHRDDDDGEEAHGNQNAWNYDERLDEMEGQFKEVKESMNTALKERKAMEEAIEISKSRASDLEAERNKLEVRNDILRADLEATKDELSQARRDLECERQSNKFKLEDLERAKVRALEDFKRELDLLEDGAQRSQREALDALRRHHQAELDDERRQNAQEIQDLRSQLGGERQELDVAMLRKDREIDDLKSEIRDLKRTVEQEQTFKASLQSSFGELSSANVTLEARIQSLKSQIEFLESDSKAQSDSFTSMETRLQDALRSAEESRQKLIKEETERRILFNKYQELKGNIRVMCRVRPVLGDSEGEHAKISFPDEKTSAEIGLQGPEEKSSLGAVSRKNYSFDFDRVFMPSVQNEDVFAEISQLVQSALDGYNVCIFCYGQTGSGKTYTMSSADGVIPRATHMIYDTITKLKEKSWEYTMEGSFIEVYNEELNDLLTPNGRDSDGKAKKPEIRHDEARKQTTVMNCKTVRLNSPESVERMLNEAQNNRSVAATKANERSSRSHSVFILKLAGENHATGERCEGTLNLVDLAGSERLKQSGAEGDRMKETQNINKSLSCLGDVIEALGRGSGHVPYRNSKLTHLLQYSLGGNSKTLMFVMVSPLEVHLRETLTSLRFATKVHNTHIGTAKATKKIKDKGGDA